MNNLKKILPYIKHDLEASNQASFKILINKGGGYEWLRKDKHAFTIEEFLKCRKPYVVVDYSSEHHCLFLREPDVTIYTFFLQCQIDCLVVKGFVDMNIVWNHYKSKKALNDDILCRLRKINPCLQKYSLKDFSVYYDVPWFFGGVII